MPSTAPAGGGGGLALPAVVGALDTPVGKGNTRLPNELGRSEDGRTGGHAGRRSLRIFSKRLIQVCLAVETRGYPCNSTKAAFVGDNDLCTVIPDHPIIP